MFAIFAAILASNIALQSSIHNQQASVIALVAIVAMLLGFSIFCARQSHR